MEFNWQGDLLCEFPIREGVKSISYKAGNSINSMFTGFIQAPPDYKQTFIKTTEPKIGNQETCYGYRRSTKSPQMMVQSIYLDGVLQMPKIS